jgi:hypothetical protein
LNATEGGQDVSRGQDTRLIVPVSRSDWVWQRQARELDRQAGQHQ